MAFVISANANAPVGYSSPAGHDTEAAGYREFFYRLRRFLTGNPEIDTLSKVGTHDTELLNLDTHDNVALTTGTYSLRMNVDTVSMTLSHSTAGTLDANVPAPAGALTQYNFDRSEAHGLAFEIDRTTDVDPAAATTEGWDWTLASNGLSSDDRWFAESYGTAGSILRGRRVSASSDPTDYFWIDLGLQSTNFQIRVRGRDDADTVVDADGYKFTPLTETGNLAYWIVASNRHFAWVARLAGDYHQMWAGLIDTFATKEQYPYPLLIAADAASNSIASGSSVQEHMAFVMNSDGSSRFRNPEGIWRDVAGTGVQSGTGFDSSDLGSLPAGSTSGFWPYHCPTENVENQEYDATARAIGLQRYLGASGNFLTPLRGPTSGERYVLPVMVVQGESDRHPLIGEIANVFCTNGEGDPAPVEEIFEISSVSYVMFPNIQRQQEQNWWALKLE